MGEEVEIEALYYRALVIDVVVCYQSNQTCYNIPTLFESLLAQQSSPAVCQLLFFHFPFADSVKTEKFVSTNRVDAPQS